VLDVTKSIEWIKLRWKYHSCVQRFGIFAIWVHL